MTEPLTLAQRLLVRWEATDEPTAKKINRMILEQREAAAEIARLTAANKALTEQIEKATDPEYLATAMEKVGVCDVARAIEAENDRDRFIEGKVLAECQRDAAEAKLSKVEETLAAMVNVADGDEKEIAELKAERGKARQHTSSLLARIHRDGGHYESEHGTSKAVEDADVIVASLFSDRDRLSAELAEARKPDELDPVTVTAIADWIDSQRREVPAHGWEFSSAIRSLSPEAPHREAKEARE